MEIVVEFHDGHRLHKQRHAGLRRALHDALDDPAIVLLDGDDVSPVADRHDAVLNRVGVFRAVQVGFEAVLDAVAGFGQFSADAGEFVAGGVEDVRLVADGAVEPFDAGEGLERFDPAIQFGAVLAVELGEVGANSARDAQVLPNFQESLWIEDASLFQLDQLGIDVAETLNREGVVRALQRGEFFNGLEFGGDPFGIIRRFKVENTVFAGCGHGIARDNLFQFVEL